MNVGFRFRRAGYQAIDRICDHYHYVQEKPVKPNVEPGYLRKVLPGRVTLSPAIARNAHHLGFRCSAGEGGGYRRHRE